MKRLLNYIFEKIQKKFTDIIVVCNGELLLLKRANYMKMYKGKWCLPGGHINNRENSKTAIIRELKEETGIIINECKLWKTWTYKNGDTTDIYEIYLKEKPVISISNEHSQYKWVKLNAKELEKYRTQFAGDGYLIIEEILNELADDISKY